MPSLHRFGRIALALAAALPALLTAFPAAAAAKPSRLQTEARTFLELLREAHYARGSVTDFSSLAADFIDQLDADHLIFLADEREALISRHRDALFEALRTQGDWRAAAAIDDAYVTRARERMTWVLQRLEGDFDLTTDQTYAPDRSRAQAPADQAAANDIWERRLKAELIEEMLNGASLEQARSALRTRWTSRRDRLVKLPEEDLVELLLTTLAHLYGPHSTYFSAASRRASEAGPESGRKGLGLLLAARSGGIFVQQVVSGGPAARAGTVRVGDRILSVAEAGGGPVGVDGLSLRQVTELTAGKAGTDATLELQPAASSNPAMHSRVVLTRGAVDSDAVRADAFSVEETGSSQRRLAVVRVTSLYGAIATGADGTTSVSSDVARLLTHLEEKEHTGVVVLDLRGNGGGFLSEAGDLAGLFVGQDPVLRVRSYDGAVQVLPSQRKRPLYTGPLVVLVDGATASGAEIVAGALQDYGRAVVVGTGPTVGIGTVQTVLDLRNLVPALAASKETTGMARLTVQAFFLPSGRSTQFAGVQPDVVVPALDQPMVVREADQPHALKLDRLPPLASASRPRAALPLDSLRAQSAARCSQPPYALAENSFRRRAERRVQPLSLDFERRRQEWETDLQLDASARAQPAPAAPDRDFAPGHAFRLQGRSVITPASNEPARLADDLMLLEALHIALDLSPR